MTARRILTAIATVSLLMYFVVLALGGRGTVHVLFVLAALIFLVRLMIG